mmetsp:Transcript_178760/g.572948  ORF Transcript_178760/g.572948 Transcript_178760/m.572948 type:complete len:202 (-) Transcript_178760:802-1407(-)
MHMRTQQLPLQLSHLNIVIIIFATVPRSRLNAHRLCTSSKPPCVPEDHRPNCGEAPSASSASVRVFATTGASALPPQLPGEARQPAAHGAQHRGICGAAGARQASEEPLLRAQELLSHAWARQQHCQGPQHVRDDVATTGMRLSNTECRVHEGEQPRSTECTGASMRSDNIPVFRIPGAEPVQQPATSFCHMCELSPMALH